MKTIIKGVSIPIVLAFLVCYGLIFMAVSGKFKARLKVNQTWHDLGY